MVGGFIERDIEPAKKLKLKTALSKNGQKQAKAGTPDYELINIKDLLCIL